MANDGEPAPVLTGPARPWLVPTLALVLFAVTVAVFRPALRGEFIDFDDRFYVVVNPHVNTGLTRQNVTWAITSLVESNWHPLTWMSLMLDCTLYGLQPWGYHLTNILLHGANAALAFLGFRKLTGSTWRSFAVAALFSLHLLRVESVASIAERKDVLSVFFFLLTLLAYAAYVERSRPHGGAGAPRITLQAGLFYLVALMLFALGLMSKTMLVTVPFVLLLLDFWPLERLRLFNAQDAPKAGRAVPSAPPEVIQSPTSANLPQNSGPLGTWRPAGEACAEHGPARSLLKSAATNWRVLLEKAPFFLLVIPTSILSYSAQHQAGRMELMNVLSLTDRVENALVSYVRYIAKLLWPAGLCVNYPHPLHWPVLLVAGCAVLVLAISIGAWVLRKRYPFFIVGWLWYLGTLVPVVGFIQIGDQSIGDRYIYIPCLGLLLVLVWGTAEWAPKPLVKPVLVAPVCAALLVFCALLTRHQIQFWSDGLTLFRRSIALTAPNPASHYALARILAWRNRYAEACAEYQTAVRLRPGVADAYNDYGFALVQAGRPDEAMVQFRKVLELRPDFADTHNSLGALLFRAGNLDEAIAEFQAALKLRPDLTSASNNLEYVQRVRGGFK